MLCHIFQLPSYCVSMLVHILLIQGHPLVVLFVWILFFVPSGWTRMPKNLLYLSMLLSSQTLFMLHHKIWSSQIRTTLCEEHSESPIRHRLKLPKPLCDSRSDRFFHFGPTEITKLIWVFNLGATDLNFSVSPICCNWTKLCISVPPSCSTRSHQQGRAIYTHGQKFGKLSPNPFARA